MTESVASEPAPSFDWLLNDLVRRVPHIGHAVVLTTDGLLMAASGDLQRDEAEQLSALASGFHSLAKGAGRHFGGGAVRQTMVEMELGFLFVCTAGHNTVLTVLTPDSADLGVVAYEMALLVKRMGEHLTVGTRGDSSQAAAQ
ncbi:roadblock/LC7 domain-containing protein [Streptomyces sp. NPDC093228]|uniref:roadblock/LC7 domain-containing protein n=1 Tax=Streptomyces sp. NPDC093228 TaxID=3155070 RepID=UPI0034471153